MTPLFVNSRSGRRGFTVPETLVAAFLGFVCAGIWSSTLPAASRAMSKGRHEDLAAGACYAELEARRLKGCDYIPSGASAVTLTGTSLLRTLPTDLPNATGSLRVRRVDLAGFKPTYTYVETSTDTGRLRLDMTVTWQGIKNDKGSVTVSSLVLR